MCLSPFRPASGTLWDDRGSLLSAANRSTFNGRWTNFPSDRGGFGELTFSCQPRRHGLGSIFSGNFS